MGRKELAVRKVGSLNLREVAARATLRTVRQQGHVYVELRQITKRSIFFCTLCLTPCFSEAVLYDHLRGSLHTKRYNSAKITLLLPNPWPFNDGVLFFDNSREKDLSISLVSESTMGVVSVVSPRGYGAIGNGDEVTSKIRGTEDQVLTEMSSYYCINNHEKDNDKDDYNCSPGTHNTVKSVIKIRKCKGVQEYFCISYVLPTEEVQNLELKIIGFGHIGSKIHEEGEKSCNFTRIWCAWLGDGNSDGCDEFLASPKCDFAVVNISYTYDLGKRCAIEVDNRLPSPDSFFEIDESGKRTKKRKKSFSDPEDSSEAYIDRCASSCNNSQNLGSYSPDIMYFRSSRHMFRQGSRKQNCSAERNCDICRQPMLPGKDVATLLNLKTGRFACSSRNINGAFHLFHSSCLIHWVLLSEFELWATQTLNPRTPRGRRGKSSLKNNFISSIFCPECQGTGVHIEGNALEKPSVPLSETFLYKLKAIKAQKAWMESPENLQKCSTGLCFPSDSTEKLQGKVMPGKLLLFYQAAE